MLEDGYYWCSVSHEGGSSMQMLRYTRAEGFLDRDAWTAFGGQIIAVHAITWRSERLVCPQPPK